MTTPRDYKLIFSQSTLDKIIAYKGQLTKTPEQAGAYFKSALDKILNEKNLKNISVLSTEDFIAVLVNTKKPKIFAESEVSGNGTDWNQNELAILGDMNIAVSVNIYDDGTHADPTVHIDPFTGTLLFTPGALLKSKTGIGPDLTETVIESKLSEDALYRLYERRLLPLLLEANAVSQRKGKKAFITIPGIGCGAFAGEYKEGIHAKFQGVLEKLLKTHGDLLKNIGTLYYDPYMEGYCGKKDETINGINFRVRPLLKKDETNNDVKIGKPQLCRPVDYREEKDDFSQCEFFSFVAWDPVSWPGNDFYAGDRSTDDGVKAAATDVISVMTGAKGVYVKKHNKYEPIALVHDNWLKLIQAEKLTLNPRGQIYIQVPGEGQLKKLSDVLAASKKTALATLKAKAHDKDKDGNTPLHEAAISNDIVAIEALSDAKADFNAINNDGDTPLHDAVTCGIAEAIEALIKGGAYPDKGNKNNITPLYKAVENGHITAVEVLLKGGADPNKKDLGGNTSLHQAIKHGKEKVIEALINAQANPHEKNNNGKTPLDELVDTSQLKLAKTLLAKLDLKNPIYRAEKKIYDDALPLWSKGSAEDKAAIINSLQLANNVVNMMSGNSTDAEKTKAINELNANALTLAQGKPSTWKKFIGALTALAGVAVLALSAAGVLFTGGASLIGLYAASSLFAAVGVTLFGSGLQTGFSKGLSNLGNTATQQRQVKI